MPIYFPPSAAGGGTSMQRPSTLNDGTNTYYSMPDGSGMTGAEQANDLQLSRVYYGPTWLALASFTITAVQIDVVAAIAGNNVRLGLARIQASDDQPVALVTDFGTVATATTGLKAVTGLTTAIVAGNQYATLVIRDTTGGGSLTIRGYPAAYGHFGMNLTNVNRVNNYRYSASSAVEYTSGFNNPPTNWTVVADHGSNALPGPREFLLVKRSA